MVSPSVVERLRTSKRREFEADATPNRIVIGKAEAAITTQAEISNLLRLSYPGWVITRELQFSLTEFSRGRSPSVKSDKRV